MIDLSLGRSCRDAQITVASLIVRAFPYMFTLALAAVACALALAVPLALVCAWRPRGKLDAAASALALLGLAVPSLWLGLLLDALAVRDWKVIEGTVLVMACSYVVINLLVDLLYTTLDPRLRAVQSIR